MSENVSNNNNVCIAPAWGPGPNGEFGPPAPDQMEYDDYLDLLEYAQDHIRHATTVQPGKADSQGCAESSLDSAIGRLQEARQALAGGLVLPPDYELIVQT